MYNPDELAIYIHWPFCKSKCPYCDFYKELWNQRINQDDIIDSYINILNNYHNLLPERKIKSVFFGGGTPSLIKPQNIEKILNFITSKWAINSNIEISLEANPNTNNNTLFQDLKVAGINRLSLGVQALNDEDLRFLGRTHTSAEARLCLEMITKIFSNHSADLIYALPAQKLSVWQNELTEICSYGLKHLSLYQLTIEEGTVFSRKNIKTLPEDKAVEFYEFTHNFLAQYGYDLYEVSNFAQKGYASQHNLTYWQGGDYIGIGASAHGRFMLERKHYAATYPWQHTPVSPLERAEELIIMGLRLTAGINKKDFKRICGLSFAEVVNQVKFNELKQADILRENETFVYASPRGFLLLDYIVGELCG
jgi:oxygen-independent coproporphyrinogen-3 oxidase